MSVQLEVVKKICIWYLRRFNSLAIVDEFELRALEAWCNTLRKKFLNDGSFGIERVERL